MQRPKEERDPALAAHLSDVLFRDPGDEVPKGGEAWEIDDFLAVLRRAGYSKSADDSMLLPGLSSLEQHVSRTEYVINLVYESTREGPSQILHRAEEYGWATVDGVLKILWFNSTDKDIIQLKARIERSGGIAAPTHEHRAASPSSQRREPCQCGAKRAPDKTMECCHTWRCKCSAAHKPCLAPDSNGRGGCFCGGGDKCRNPHKDGGTCARCPTLVPDTDIVADPTDTQSLDNNEALSGDREELLLTPHVVFENQMRVEDQTAPIGCGSGDRDEEGTTRVEDLAEEEVDDFMYGSV